MDRLLWLLDARLYVLDSEILWREIIGNAFGLASALGALRRKIWAWPIGIAGNVLLFTVFLGGAFVTPQDKNLYGQACRQVFFLIVSVYGWWRWRRNQRRDDLFGLAITPRWTTSRERLVLTITSLIGVGLAYLLLQALGSWGPLADAWILVGSLVATYGMARGYIEFWLVWIAVDLVGLPLLLNGGFYPSALLYGFYAVFCVVGFVAWRSALNNAGSVSRPDRDPGAVNEWGGPRP